MTNVISDIGSRLLLVGVFLGGVALEGWLEGVLGGLWLAMFTMNEPGELRYFHDAGLRKPGDN